jgi:hypothetical protein
MSPRAKRLLRLGALAVLLLFVGRWAADFLATKWWAAALSPAAEAFTTDWMLLGLTLDLCAIAVASTWFAAQAVLVARAIGTVQVEELVGTARIRQPIPMRLLLLAGLGLGVLLGIITGAGARAWRAPLALAWQGVTYGVTDPLLGQDLGTFVAQLPLWNLAHGFALSLAILGLALAFALYAAIGAIRRHGSSIEVHGDARRHLGALLAILALVIAAGALLTPYRLAASVDPPLGIVPSRLRITAAHAMAGGAIAVAIMSTAWAIRARHSLLVGGWLVMLIGWGVERLVIPAMAAEGSGSPTREEDLRALESTFWGLRLTEAAVPEAVPTPRVTWDQDALLRWLAQRGALPFAISPAAAPVRNDTIAPTWMAILSTREEPARLEWLTVVDRGNGGQPDILQQATMPDARVYPGAPAWRTTGDSGVRVGGWIRRVVLAWARQAPTMLRTPASSSVDWRLDPVERVRGVLPMLSWRLTGVLLLAERPVWVVTGFATVRRAPMMRDRSWGGLDVAGVTPAILGFVDIASGGLTLMQDPAADALGRAWATIAGSLIEPAGSIPQESVQSVAYPAEWLEAQLHVLEGPQWELGRRPGRRVADGPPEAPAVLWTAGEPSWQAPFEDPGRRSMNALVSAQRRDGTPQLQVARVDGVAPDNGRELERRWGRGIMIRQLRDSVRAAGDSLIAGPLRWHLSDGMLAASMSLISEGRKSPPALVWIATARGNLLGGGREVGAAWASLMERSAGDSMAAPSAPDADARLAALRTWINRADSALARGDLTAFGRAWEAVRGLLGETEEP